MSALIKYDQARLALAACRNVDDIKDIRDKSEAMRLYAKQANDTELEQWAAEIKLRAQRAIGEISAGLEKQKNQAALPSGGKSKNEALKDAGISTSTANRYEKLASIPDADVEALIAQHKDDGKPVSAKAVLATLAKPNPVETKSPELEPVATPEVADVPQSEVDRLREHINELADHLEATMSENETLLRVVESDDKVLAALEEVKRYKAVAESAERTLAGKNGEYIERAKAVTYWQNRANRFEKELKQFRKEPA